MLAELERLKWVRRLRTSAAASAAVAFVVLSALLSQWIWKENGLRSIQAVNEQRVQLVANALVAEIGRQDHLPIVLSLDADVRDALVEPGNRKRLEALSRKLRHISDEADTRGLYVIGADGVVLASDDWESPDTLVGRNLSDRSYFRNAVRTGKSASLGRDGSNGQVRYHIAEAVRGSSLLGVVVVKVEFDTLEATWERASELVLVTDPGGIVFLSSNADFKYRRIESAVLASKAADESIASQLPVQSLPTLEIGVRERRDTSPIVAVATEDGTHTYLYQAMPLPKYGWTIHRLADLSTSRSDQRDGAIIGGTIATLVIVLLLNLMMRHRAYVAARATGARLKAEVAERTRELQDVNASLQLEIEERRRTETRLRTTQNELVQAGKLAALGQMSAAIAHEINQPLAAIRTFMASTKIFAERGDLPQVIRNLDIVSNLADRMANITAHLKVFARKSEPGRAEPVHVGRAIDGALFLIESQVKAARVSVDIDIEAPDVWVSGHVVQLEQVMVNLIGNALDAVSGRDRPWIGIRLWLEGETVNISVADNGPGIPAELIDRIFDPFITTKPVGKGLGLGLSISYGIVQDFHGRISAANRPQGGAQLVIALPRLMPRAENSPVGAVHA
jgi:two-component system C4-dicarboxylate transport sensor histidine kinase DctB